MKKRMASLAALFFIIDPMIFPEGPSLPALPKTLDEMLDLALRANPDILVAEAKLRQAQAELNQARLKVAKEVLSAYNQRRMQELTVKALREGLEDVRKRVSVGTSSTDEVRKAALAQAEAEAVLSAGVGTLQYLVGLGGKLELPEEKREAKPQDQGPKRVRRPPIPERFREALEKPVHLQFENLALDKIIAQLQAEAGNELPFVLDPSFDRAALTATMDLQKVLPLRTALLALHDQFQGLCFVFRDYGILVSIPGNASQIPGAAIPPEVPFEAPEPPAETPEKSQ